MSLRVEDIYNYLDNLAPLKIQEPQDNSGLQLGSLSSEVKGILLTVDITKGVVDFAKAKGLNLIISHHPLLFNPLKCIDIDTPKGRLIQSLLSANITVLSWHTPLDKVEVGVSEAIVRALGFEGRDFITKQEVNGKIYGLGRVVYLEKSIKLQDLAKKLKSATQSWVMLVGEADSSISSFGVCGGSGSFLISELKALGINTLITSDVKYHTAKDCEEEGFNLLIIDHGVSESMVLVELERRLKGVFDPQFDVVIYREKSPFKIL